MTPSEPMPILPCPFCGSVPNVMTDRGDEHSEWVACSNSECPIYADGMTHEQWEKRPTAPDDGKQAGRRISKLRESIRLAAGMALKLWGEIDDEESGPEAQAVRDIHTHLLGTLIGDEEDAVAPDDGKGQPVALKDALPVVVKELRCAASRIGDAGMINEAVQYGLLARELERILGERK